jgi:hypothetical protein
MTPLILKGLVMQEAGLMAVNQVFIEGDTTPNTKSSL